MCLAAVVIVDIVDFVLVFLLVLFVCLFVYVFAFVHCRTQTYCEDSIGVMIRSQTRSIL